MKQLPIDIVESNPMLFRWRAVVSSPIGERVIEHEGPVLPTMEQPLADLIALAKQQATVIEQLREELRRRSEEGGHGAEG